MLNVDDAGNLFGLY